MSKNMSVGVTIDAVMGKNYDKAFDAAEKKAAHLGDTLKKTGKETSSAFNAVKNPIGNALAGERLTWNQFTGQRMGQYMKEMGSHKAAIGKIAEEWKVYKATGVNSVAAVEKAVKGFKAKNYANPLDAANGVIKYKQVLGELAAKQEKAGGSNKRLKVGITAVTQQYKEAKRAAKGYGLSIGDIVREQQRLNRESNKLIRTTERLNRKEQAGAKLANQRMKAFGLLGGAYAASRIIKHDATFEHELRLFGNVGRLSDQQLMPIREQLRGLSPEVNQSKTELLGGLNVLVGRGMKPDKAVKAIKAIGFAATATQATIEDLSLAGYAVTNNMGIPASDIGKSLNIMASAGKEGGFELRDMAKYLSVLTAQSKMLGLSGQEGVASLGAALQIAMDGAGDASIGANNLQNFLMKIASNETVKKFNKLGVSVENVINQAKMEGKDPVIAMVEMVKELSKSNPFEIGKMFEDMQVKNFLNPMILNMDKFYRIKKKALNEPNVISEDFSAMMRTATERMKGFTIGLVNVGDAISTSLMPVIKPMLTVLGKVSNAASDFIHKYPLVGQVIGGVAAAFGVITAGAITYTASVWLLNTATVAAIGSTLRFIGAMAVKPVLLMASGVKLAAVRLRAFNAAALVASLRVAPLKAAFMMGGVLSLAKTKIGALGASLLTFAKNPISGVVKGLKSVASGIRVVTMAIITNPIGLAIAGIAAAGLLIYKYWQPVKAFMGGVWDGFTAAMQPVTDALSPVIDLIGSAVDWFMALIEPVKMTGEELEGFASTGKMVGEIIGGAFNLILTPIKWAMSAIGELASLWDKLFGEKKEPEINTGKIGDAIKQTNKRHNVSNIGASVSGSTTSSNYIRAVTGRGIGRYKDRHQNTPIAPIGSALAAKKKAPVVHIGSALAAKKYEYHPQLSKIELAKLQPPTPVVQHINNDNKVTVSVQQMPGEDHKALTDRIMREIARKQEQNTRAALYDTGT